MTIGDRMTLPHRRPAVTFDIAFKGFEYSVTVGYPSRHYLIAREVFINGAKTGVDMDSITRDGAILLSLALQHGVALETIQHAITRGGRGEAMSIIGHVVDRIVEHEKA